MTRSIKLSQLPQNKAFYFTYVRGRGSVKEKSKINVAKFQLEKWYLSVWDVRNVLPHEKWSKYTAAFPEELVERLITLHSYWGENILDPFLGTGTTCAVARKLGRNCIGYEIDLELREIIEERLGMRHRLLEPEAYKVEILVREDARRLRTQLREEIEKRLKTKK